MHARFRRPDPLLPGRIPTASARYDATRRRRTAAPVAARSASTPSTAISPATGARSDADGAAAEFSASGRPTAGRLRSPAAKWTRAARVPGEVLGACAEAGRRAPGPEPRATASSRARMGAGRADARLGVPGPGACGPVAPGMFWQYWSWALAPLLEHGAPGWSGGAETDRPAAWAPGTSSHVHSSAAISAARPPRAARAPVEGRCLAPANTVAGDAN
jgi:hypothetical protein